MVKRARLPVQGDRVSSHNLGDAPGADGTTALADGEPETLSIAIGWISATFISVLSPGMTIVVRSGRVTLTSTPMSTCGTRA